MRIPSIEKEIGITAFASQTKGIGGVIRQRPEDFAVQEVLIDGSEASLEPQPVSQLPGEGRYLICTLTKNNRDTLLVVRKIVRQLGISERRVRIAGIKDKRAVTAQHLSIENVKIKHLSRIRISGVQVVPFRYSTTMVFPHMLYGNMFNITIRKIRQTTNSVKERIDKTLKEIQTRSTPNFFGHQRFGTIRPITHLVGKALANNNVEEAVMIFLAKPSPHEHPQSRYARQRLLETRDFKDALNFFPRLLVYERSMLFHLSKHENDFIGSLRRLPKRLLRLFLQAYQSYLFNLFLSKRQIMKIPIDEPQIGDYVLQLDHQGLPMKSYSKATPENIDILRRSVKENRMVLSIPLIGFKQAPSEGKQGEIEELILKSERIAPANFKVQSMPDISARGELRKTTSLARGFQVGDPARDELNPSHNKITTKFTLQRGSYATIILRELMKPRDPIKAGF